MKQLSKYRSGIILALITACGLGAITTQAKIVYADGGNALTLMLMRFIASTLIFALLLLVRRNGFSVERHQLPGMIWLGLIWSTAMICYLLSIETISVSLAVLILYAYPLLVLLFSIVRRLLPASPMLISLFVFAFIGLYLSLTGSDIEVDTRGVLFAALASLGAAYTFIRAARIAPTMSPLLMTFWIHAIGLIVIAPLMIGQFSMPASNAGLLFLLAATLFYVVAILCQFEALARLPAASAAFILNLEPVVSILLAGLVLQEQLSPTQWAGVTLVISVIILSIRFKPKTA